MDTIRQYFPDLTPLQDLRLTKLDELYRSWNGKINVISRKDIDHLYLHHILFSLGIAKYISFTPGTRILDAGTGGGFPGIPLAILFPGTNFTLVDSIAKKIKVVDGIVSELGLENVNSVWDRYENVKEKFDFVTGRAVTALPLFVSILMKKISPECRNDLQNGILYLKGGDYQEELNSINSRFTIYDLSSQFSDPFFETKKLVHIYK